MSVEWPGSARGSLTYCTSIREKVTCKWEGWADRYLELWEPDVSCSIQLTRANALIRVTKLVPIQLYVRQKSSISWCTKAVVLFEQYSIVGHANLLALRRSLSVPDNGANGPKSLILKRSARAYSMISIASKYTYMRWPRKAGDLEDPAGL